MQTRTFGHRFGKVFRATKSTGQRRLLTPVPDGETILRMVQSNAKSVADYLAELDPARRAEVSKVRDVILANLPAGYSEGIGYGMIAYVVPLATYPNTYNKQPLTYLGLAAQKNYLALYLTCVYCDPRQLAKLKAAFKSAGKKLDMGKACVRFKSAEELPLAAIAKLVGGVSVKAFIKAYENVKPPKKK